MQSDEKKPEKSKLKNREKYNGFGDFMLNSPDVMPILMTMGKWSGIFVS